MRPLLIAAVLALVGCTASPASPSVTPEVRHAKLNDFMGCPYPSGDVWQTNVAHKQTDPNSAAWLKAMADAGGDGGFVANAPTTDELINDASDSTPLVTVTGKVQWHTPYSPVPFQSGFYIEPLGDAHLLILQHDTCAYYEGYSATYSGGVLSEYNGGFWDLTKPFVRPVQGSISTASGIPIGLVAVRPEELAAGVIRHALGWDAVAHTLSQTACVSPAGESDCTDSLPYSGPASDTPMPYGAHARLKASFDISGFSREAQIVATAMKRYGLYVYDTGCCNTVVFVNDQNGAPTWTSSDSASLKTISPADFEIVPAP